MDKDKINIEKTLFNLDSPKVNKECNENLIKQITEEELWNVIKTSPRGKSPGSDGFTTEFYVAFWSDIKHYMLDAFNEALSEGELSISQKRGVITLIPKGNKDIRLLKNWRPITLLNTDYKYLTKCLANRCKDILPDIINHDQTGFVKGRLIGSNIIRAMNIIDICHEQNIEGLMINVDFEKAFDCINWEFLYKALKFFKFPDAFIKWIKCIYTDVETCVINNGYTTKFFKVERGMRQGCPLSPILFVIAIELLSLYVKNNIKIDGLRYKDIEYLISQFADDTSFMLTTKKGNTEELINSLVNFSLVSGLKINADKSEILLLGGAKREVLPSKYRTLIKPSVKLLGIEIHSNLETTVNVNYNVAMDCMKKSIDIWSKRHMSLAGKIAIIKTIITSKLVYCMTVLPSPPKEYWNRVNTMLFAFINNGGSDKIRRKSVIGDYSDGGFRMIDIECQNQAIKAKWLFKVATDRGAWVDVIKDVMGNIDLTYLLRCNLNEKDIPFIPQYCTHWRENLEIWCKLNYNNQVQEWAEIINQSLWLNSHIKVKGATLWNAHWYELGVKWVSDLINEESSDILTHREFNNKFQVNSTFIEYWGLVKAIPRDWRWTIRNAIPHLDEEYVTLADTIWDSKDRVKLMYNRLVKKKYVPQTDKWHKWKEDLNIEMSEHNFLKAMANGRTATINNKLRSFNYNFYIRNVTYGVRLHHMKIADNNTCHDCGKKDTLMHRYWKCPNTVKLWKKIKALLEKHQGRKLNINAKLFLLGITEGDNRYSKASMKMLQTLTLLCKYYIHSQLCKRESTTVRGLVSYVKFIKRVEEEIANEKGSRRFHVEKWSVLHTDGI